MGQAWVAWADPASGHVIGVYSTREGAEAAAYRYSKTPRHFNGETLEVLVFDVDRDGETKDDVTAIPPDALTEFDILRHGYPHG